MKDIKNVLRIRHQKNTYFIDFYPSEISRRQKVLSKLFNFVEEKLTVVDSFMSSAAVRLVGLTSAVGLGLGFGIAISVMGQPDLIHAGSMDLNTDPLVRTRSITFPKLQTTIGVAHPGNAGLNKVRELTYENVGGSAPIVIGDFTFSGRLEEIKELELGDIIELTATNNGVYRYRVYEIRVIESRNLSSVINSDREVIVLYTPENTLRTTVYAVSAAPAR